MEAKELGSLIAYERKKKGISVQQLSAGICSISALKRLCAGERGVDFFVLQRIISRLGISENKFNILYDQPSLQLVLLRDRIEVCLDQRDESCVRTYLQSYKNQSEAGLPLHRQYILMIEAMLLAETEQHGLAMEKLENALETTVPGFVFERLDCFVLGEEELLLVIALLRERIRHHSAQASTAYEQVKHYIDHHFEDDEVLLCLRSKLQWVWIDELMRKRDYQQAFQTAVRMLEQLGENGSLLHITHYLDRVITICRLDGRAELEEYRRMRDALARLYSEYDRVWESGELRLWKRTRVNGVEGIANMLRCEREAAGLTQEQLAELLELDTKTVSRIECGRSQPKAGTLQRILEQFRYGSTACYTKLVVGSFAMLDQEREIARLVTYDENDRAEKLFLQLKSRLSHRYQQNRQYIAFMEFLFDKRNKRKSREQLLSELIEAYCITRKTFAVEKIASFVPSQMEGMILNNIALLYDDSGKTQDCISLLEQMRTGYENSPADLRHYYTIVSVVYTNLAMSYEDLKQFDKAIALYVKAIRFSLQCNRGNRLGVLIKGKVYTSKNMTDTDQQLAYQDAFQLMKLMKNSSNTLERMEKFYFEKYRENFE